MLERLSEKFAGELVSAGVISETDADVYMFGFFQVVMLLLNVLTTFILGVVFRLIIPCIILNLAYIPIRTSAGGHHADSPLKCYINSTIIIAILLAVIKWISIPNTFSIALMVISSIAIWILAPVETENNPLDEMEQRVYRKRTQILLCIELIICLIFLILSKNWITSTITLGLFTECLMLISGKVKNIKSKK